MKRTGILFFFTLALIIIVIIELFSLNPTVKNKFLQIFHLGTPNHQSEIIPIKGITEFPPGYVRKMPESFLLVANIQEVSSDLLGNIYAKILFYPRATLNTQPISQQIMLLQQNNSDGFIELIQQKSTLLQGSLKDQTSSIVKRANLIKTLNDYIPSTVTLSFAYNNPSPYIQKNSLIEKQLQCNTAFLQYITLGDGGTFTTCIPILSTIYVSVQ